MNHEEFKLFREKALRDNPSLHDGGQLNFYEEAEKWGFERIVRCETHGKHRCHAAKKIEELTGLKDCIITQGVRASLKGIFSQLKKEGKTIALPEDVYPVYLALALEAGVSFTTYRQKDIAEGRDTWPQEKTILVCQPSKPWGGNPSIPFERYNEVFVDAVYSYFHQEDGFFQNIQLDGWDNVLILNSLAKSFLLPDTLGYCYGPLRERYKETLMSLTTDTAKLEIGYYALLHHAGRPQELKNILDERMKKALNLCLKKDISVLGNKNDPENEVEGYFLYAKESPEELMKKGILGIPCSVFGSKKDQGTVLSTLSL